MQVNLYFDEDGHSDTNEDTRTEKLNTEVWTGEGELMITDFAKFVRFLQSVMCSHIVNENEPQL